MRCGQTRLINMCILKALKPAQRWSHKSCFLSGFPRDKIYLKIPRRWNVRRVYRVQIVASWERGLIVSRRGTGRDGAAFRYVFNWNSEGSRNARNVPCEYRGPNGKGSRSEGEKGSGDGEWKGEEGMKERKKGSVINLAANNKLP